MAECKDILKKVFYILDGNFDDWFNLEDLDQLDELALVDLNKKISKMTERFNKLNEKHLENINKVCIDCNILRLSVSVTFLCTRNSIRFD